MKKFLRFSLVALFAVLGMSNAMAEDTFTFTQGIFSNGLTVTIDDVEWTLNPTWKSESAFNYDATKGVQIGTAKKPATSFTISTTGISKKIQSVVVNCSGANGIAGTVNVTVGGTAFGSEYTLTSTATDAQFTGSSAVSGTIEVTFAQTSEKGMYLKSITLYYEDDAVKSPAGIAWSKATASVTYGNADDTYKYLPTFQNPNNLTGITFSSDNSDAVSISTDGEIKVEGVGVATLTASFAGNDQYEADEVTCKVTVKEAEPEKTDISNTKETAYTIVKAIELIEDANSDLTKEVYVKGRVSKVDSYNSTYKSITYWISDDGTTTSQQFEIYGGLNIGGADGDGFASKDDIKVGATVVVKGKMKKFISGENIIYEMDKNNVLISYDESTAIDVPETEATIADLYNFTSATSDIKLTITNGKVVYVNGNSAYVRDGAKAIYFYNTGLSLPLNAEVSGTVNVDLDIYNGLHEVKKNSKTSADNLTITESSEEAAPVEATFDKLASKDYTNDLIIIKNQSVIEDDGKWYIQNGDAKIQLFKKNADYSSYVSDTKKYDIIAIATVYNSNAQLTPISFSETTGISALTIDTDVNAPMYNLKGERVDANYRGVVIKAGKKTIQK